MSINKKLEIIQDFHDYIGKILAKGYMNDDCTLDNLIDIITKTDYNDKSDEDNITLEDEEEDDEEEKTEESEEEENEEEEKTEESEEEEKTVDSEEDDKYEPVKKISYLSLFSKKQPDPVYNTSVKIDDFITNKSKVENVLLYKNNTSYVDRLSNYLQYITTY